MRRRLGALALALAACAGEQPPARSEPSASPGLAPPQRQPSGGPQAGTPTGRSRVDPTGAAGPIPPETRQLVLATTDGWDSIAGELRRFERVDAASPWRPVGEPWPAVLGVSGAAWGRGRHGAGAPDGQAGPIKVEGDGKSPAGVFALGDAWGYADAPLAGQRLTYHPSGPSARCIDDPASRFYNQILPQSAELTSADWRSSELMRRKDALYRWLIVVDHNGGVSGAPSPGLGSCIFVHVWRDAEHGTAGCTAMDRARLEALLDWIDPAALPLFILLPQVAYSALASAWQLP